IDVAVAYGLVSEADLLVALTSRPTEVEIVCTGRGASEALIAFADLVTEMVMRKHPYEHGIPARRGIEF
ncbi:MAG: cob(I)yrinic acid a,c-diamide adenosyltransferase, partial [Actinomycetota bacterium]|nr:cob(I)yrinic acid a,c-diamide adenosyltransferase [Actinomycetota bacterium]